MIHGRQGKAHAPTASLRRAPLFLKIIAVTVTVAFLGLTLQPLAIAANLPAAPKAAAPRPASHEEKLAKTLEDVEDRLEKLEKKLTRKEDATREKDELSILHQELDALDKQARANFDAIERHLKDKKLPPVILDRHTEAVKTYQQEMASLKANLDDLDAAKDDTERKTKAQKAKEHLKLKNTKRARPKFDPNDLPNKSLQPNPKNKPKRTKEDFIRAGLFDNPTVKLAAHGTYRIDQLPSAADPAYRAATTEVTLTSAIRAKAAELGHNPVKIYNWVRNNVEWIPTWGATQDADITLGSQRGNAMDIASLLIALYRASDIPARYVHGTIEMPAERFTNWAGGFTSITAAGDYASSGGIPVTTIVSGGKITKVQIEHIWVEAAIDFYPSRGAVNKSADAWIQLDPSFKQYQDLPGLDVVQIAGIDPTALAQSFASSGTINQSEGWVQGSNLAILQSAETQVRTTLKQHIQTNLPNATVGDVIGGRRIVSQSSSVLPTGLPYYPGVKVRGATYGALPTTLQNTMTFAFGIDPLGEPINPVTFPWPRLNNHKVTLSFKPATSADEQTLASLLPAGPITDPSQLPSSIPSYLINVIPEIAVDGQVVGQGTPMRLGEYLIFYYGLTRFGSPFQTYTYPVVAGSYLSVAATGGSVASSKLEVLRAKIRSTQTTLLSGDQTAIGALSREDFLGDLFYAATLSYFGEYLAVAHVQSLTQKGRHNLPVAYGTFGYEPNVRTLFGFPRAIENGGMGVNVRLGWVVQSINGDASNRHDMTVQVGMLSSALEHGVPEQMFSTPTQRAQGVSAVRALQLAAQQGQRIYHITPQNQAQALPNLHLDALAMGEITQALVTGKEVITHTDRISVPGWTGEGYIISDPVTGDAAYKITGGANGGFLKVLLVVVVFALAFYAIGALIAAGVLGLGLGLLSLALTAYNFFDFVKKLGTIENDTEFEQLIFIKTLSALIAATPTKLLELPVVDILRIFAAAFLGIFGATWFG